MTSNDCVNGNRESNPTEENEEGMEEGEITDTEDSGFIPVIEGKVLSAAADSNDISDSSDPLESEDDEPPEEILNKVARKKVEESGLLTQEIDPKLCFMCQKTPHKYRCPKCDLRTCSVVCSKQHKEVKNCDGVRPPFQPVSKLSQFDANKSVQDQRFLHAVQSSVKNPSLLSSPLPSTSKEQRHGLMSEERRLSKAMEHGGQFSAKDESEENLEGFRHKVNSVKERYLMQNALRRRIWLSFSDDKGGEDSSRHEQFSDTIFWCVDLIFNKQLEGDSISTYTYRVQNIPETIRLVTILRQFLKPRQHGCIVSRSDLDLEKLSPFIEAGIEGVNGFMRVPGYEPERFYLVDLQKDVLHNTRNRVIIDHPKIIITLDTEFITSYCLISEAEAEEIRQKQRQSRAMARSAQEGSSHDFSHGDEFRGRRSFRGGRGTQRGGFRGGFHGQNDYRISRGQRGGFWGRGGSGKRFSDHDDFGYQHKKVRGGRGGGERGLRRNYRSLDEEFDPFEPFEGPIRLPRSYLGSKNDGDGSASADSQAANSQRSEQNNAMSNGNE